MERVHRMGSIHGTALLAAVQQVQGDLWLTIRNAGAGWSVPQEVNSQFPIPSRAVAVAATWDGNPGETQFMFSTPDGLLGHTIRLANGGWTGLGAVNGQFTIPGPVTAVAATWDGNPGETQFMFTTSDGRLWHTIRLANAGWTGLGAVNSQFTIPGPVTAVSAAYDGNPGETQFMFTTSDGRLWHTIRLANGGWTGLGYVNSQFTIPGPVTAVSATWDGNPGETQFLFTTYAVTPGPPATVTEWDLWHTTRQAGGGWTPPDDMRSKVNVPGPVHAVSATWDGNPGETQFMFATDDGHLWHMIRQAGGGWYPASDLQEEITVFGPVYAVSAAYDGNRGETQLMFET